MAEWCVRWGPDSNWARGSFGGFDDHWLLCCFLLNFSGGKMYLIHVREVHMNGFVFKAFFENAVCYKIELLRHIC